MRDEPVVLVVDTDDELRSATCELLRHHGYRVVCVADVKSAREAFVETTPAVVVLCWDVATPRAEKLRLLESVPRGSAVIVTSAQSAARAEADDQGVPFLAKPFGIDDFARTVAESARRHRP